MPQERRKSGTMMCVPAGSPPWRLQGIWHRRSFGRDVRRINRDCRRLKNKRGNVLLRVWRSPPIKAPAGNAGFPQGSADAARETRRKEEWYPAAVATVLLSAH
ncbi:hypothetical protein Tc00.1047053506253.30 [Trypanosoma cruzi]|uniref:Uncharacterized protein n=1 Tax=Trypanosoma cruzi (strain CL Brener) TaxID=353153 RepID=Q4CSN2_TRYCC|nr:uncharacterized protein Tc00.1047053506253.30 [Trypanosoma cruzi]EAN83283.1 hypothetical protein Tc00.1047053506253.30 [Trypanosoma cruzi]|eukprot:XP_805134.1 hypothetical protein Tc00.1047053506253.30 [Trypanosoma cruzi strain CL Brener]